MSGPLIWPDDAPSLKAAHITLIVKQGTDLAWGAGVEEKRELLLNSRGPVWAVWTGRWSSHLFAIPRKVAEAALDVPRARLAAKRRKEYLDRLAS